MKKILLFVAMGVLGLWGCQSDEENGSANAITLGTPSKTLFDHHGGLGSVEAYAGSKTITARSSAPEWCPVTVFDNRTVAFNLYENRTDADRTATIVVSAEGLPDEEFTLTQERLKGIIATPTTLNFTSDKRTLSVEVIASCEYEIVEESNPDDTFSWKKSENGKVVDFTSKDPGNHAVEGRVSFVPEEGEPVPVTLRLERMDTYEFLLGEWNLDTPFSDGVSKEAVSKIVLAQEIRGYTYKVYFIGAKGVGDLYPATAQYLDGAVVLRTKQELGNDGSNFYSLHYNGTQNGSGTYIFNAYQNVAWSAKPLYDDRAGKVTLDFADDGNGKGSVAVTLNIFNCAGNYYQGWTELILRTNHLSISKNY